MGQVANIVSAYESGELVYRHRVTRAEVLRINGDGITFPNQVTSDPWIFDVTADEYGAVGDGVTNDTPAIQLAINAAFAYATTNEVSYAQIYFPAGIYLLSSAVTAGGATKGNAQLTIPINAGTARKVTLEFKGPGDASAMPYWEQSSGNGMRWGATLKTSLTGQSVSGTWGVPSVFGGPAVSGSSAEYGSSGAKFNNVCVVIDGIGISTPINPTIGGFDFRGMAQCVVKTASVMADGSPTQLNATRPDHDWSFGIGLPQNFNNDRNVIHDFSVYGQYTGLIIGEHAWVARSASIYCNDGIFIQATSENIHASAFGSISIEACVNGITASSGDSYGAPIHIAAVSFETITGDHINDPSNALAGYINITKLDGPTGLVIDGAANVEIINSNQDRGLVTAPDVPLTTVAIRNPFWRHAMVCVIGGTVTAIAVDGSTLTGVTSGVVFVPSGKTISWTGSGAPTWKWWTL